MSLKKFSKFCKKNNIVINDLKEHWDNYKDMPIHAINTLDVNDNIKFKWNLLLNKSSLIKKRLKNNIIAFIGGILAIYVIFCVIMQTWELITKF